MLALLSKSLLPQQITSDAEEICLRVLQAIRVAQPDESQIGLLRDVLGIRIAAQPMSQVTQQIGAPGLVKPRCKGSCLIDPAHTVGW